MPSGDESSDKPRRSKRTSVSKSKSKSSSSSSPKSSTKSKKSSKSSKSKSKEKDKSRKSRSSSESGEKKEKKSSKSKSKSRSSSRRPQAAPGSDSDTEVVRRPHILPQSRFNKPYVLSKELAAFTRKPVMQKSEVVRIVWAYIRSNHLIDPKNPRYVLCDRKLANLFGEPVLDSMLLFKYLLPHIVETVEE